MDPMTIMALASAANAGMQALKPNKITDPARYKKDIVLSDYDLNTIGNNMRRDISEGTMANIASLKQVGAATRAPSSAIMDNIAGANYQAARGFGAIEPALKNMKRQSVLDFLGMQRGFDAQAQANTDNTFDNLSGSLGNLVKYMMLKKAGFFDVGQNNSAAGTPQMFPDDYLKVG